MKRRDIIGGGKLLSSLPNRGQPAGLCQTCHLPRYRMVLCSLDLGMRPLHVVTMREICLRPCGKVERESPKWGKDHYAFLLWTTPRRRLCGLVPQPRNIVPLRRKPKNPKNTSQADKDKELYTVSRRDAPVAHTSVLVLWPHLLCSRIDCNEGRDNLSRWTTTHKT